MVEINVFFISFNAKFMRILIKVDLSDYHFIENIDYLTIGYEK